MPELSPKRGMIWSGKPLRGAIATPREILSESKPYQAMALVDPNFINKPYQTSWWGNNQFGDCVTAEEAFAKSCGSEGVLIPDSVAISWARVHGVLNGAHISDVLTWMQKDGFPSDHFTYENGSPFAINWKNRQAMQSAIMEGPVKIGVAADQIESAFYSTNGNSGWLGLNFKEDTKYDHCISVFGYGSISWIFQKIGKNVPTGVDGNIFAYAVFTWNSVGVIDEKSLEAVTCEAWIRRPTTIRHVRFGASFHEGDPGKGIGGYDLKSVNDRAFAFDYERSGRLDHIVIYRPGRGAIFILRNKGGNFTPVYQQNDPGHGIGGYDLKSVNDRAFAFDYEHSGRLDHIVIYRPGRGAIFILRNKGGNFTPVYQQIDPGQGIGGYDLKSVNDRAFAFDYEHTGKLDHIVIYRPGTGAIFILRNNGGNFTPVYQQNDPGHGIGGYDLKSVNDRAFAFDYEHTGKLDHIVIYRPARGAIFILRNNGGNFTPVYQQIDPGHGIGGYDLKSVNDQAFAYDVEGTGKQDHIVIYRPGRGAIFILRNNGGNFTPVYEQIDPGQGIGGYDLKSVNDQAFALENGAIGTASSICLFRPGRGTFWVVSPI